MPVAAVDLERTPKRSRALPVLLGVLLGLVGIVVIIGSIASLAPDKESSGDAATIAVTNSEQAGAVLFPGRADAQREDQERNVGESASVGGLESAVKSAGFQQSFSEFEEDGYLVLDVSYRNVADEAKPYNVFDWKIQRPSGVVENAWQSGSAYTQEQIGSGDLVPGGSLDKKLIFTVGAEKGDFYVIWKPDPFDAARGVWKVTI